MQVSTIQPESQKMIFYISEDFKIYFEGQNLTTQFGENIKINKFIKHKHRKTKIEYLCVNIQSLQYKTKNSTLPVEYLDSCK